MFMIKFIVYIEIVLLSVEFLLIYGDFKIYMVVYDGFNCVLFKDLFDFIGF